MQLEVGELKKLIKKTLYLCVCVCEMHSESLVETRTAYSILIPELQATLFLKSSGTTSEQIISFIILLHRFF